MNDAFICDYVRTPIGKYGGALSAVRVDNLAAHVLADITKRTPALKNAAIDDVIFGCANQAGEDNRNVARMAVLLAGLSVDVPAATVNRLCGSGLDAVLQGARAIKTGEAELIIAGGVEGMSRAPFVMPKSHKAFSRQAEIFDTTMGWRFINPKMQERYGTDTMPATAENVAQELGISRDEQDRFALLSQEKTAAAKLSGRLTKELAPVQQNDETLLTEDEHPRQTTLEKLGTLKPLFSGGTVTAGNSSGINDGAAALVIASEKAAAAYGLKPLARVIGGAVSGLEPRLMGLGPIEACRRALARYELTFDNIGIIELNEAFASQSIGVLRGLGLDTTDTRLNRNGGAIALGHPLGMSGARIAGSAVLDLHHCNQKLALATMCIGVGQGIAALFEKV